MEDETMASKSFENRVVTEDRVWFAGERVKMEVDTRDPEKPGQLARIYFFIGEFNVMKDLKTRFNQPHQEFRYLLPWVLKAAGHEGTWDEINRLVAKFRWSQKAGCSCGCSPGFIAPRGWSKDIFVTLGEEKKTTAVTPPKLPALRSLQMMFSGQGLN